jgi:hypothetical protein
LTHHCWKAKLLLLKKDHNTLNLAVFSGELGQRILLQGAKALAALGLSTVGFPSGLAMVRSAVVELAAEGLADLRSADVSPALLQSTYIGSTAVGLVTVQSAGTGSATV